MEFLVISEETRKKVKYMVEEGEEWSRPYRVV